MLPTRVAELVKRIADYQLFSVMLWNEETRMLRHAFSLSDDGRFCQKTNFPLGYGITGTSAALRQPLRVPNVHLDPRYVRCGHQVEVGSELCVPLVFKDRLIGVVDLESVHYNAFTEQDEQMLSILASYIAVAIENSRLYDRVSQGEKRLADDLATARDIQKGLLPDETPEVPGLAVAFAYEPARQLGGDFYDFLPYGEGRIAVAVGDVAGKATAAALQGSLAVGVMRAHVVQHLCDPSEMLEHLNEPLIQPRLGNRYVAMAFALYDASGKTLSIANAGFPRPHLIRDGLVEEIPVQGTPLGLMPDMRYQQEILSLRIGDVVVFCSDGVVECENRNGEDYGGERLGRLVVALADAPAREIADRILQATANHLGREGEFADDRTVVVLKVTG